jgi:hypothetical protein
MDLSLQLKLQRSLDVLTNGLQPGRLTGEAESGSDHSHGLSLYVGDGRQCKTDG